MYKNFESFIFRSPSLPFSESLFPFNEELLWKELSDSKIQESIYLASPVLYNELQKLLNKEIKNSKELDRIIHSCSRYLSRMSTRCTPFGLFAGCSIGRVEEKSGIKLNDKIGTTTRLDMYYLCTLYDALVKKDKIKNKIKYFPNTSLYVVGKHMRYIEIQYAKGKRTYQIAEVEQSSYLKFLLKKARGGVYIHDLAQSLVSEYISLEDATDFIYELIDSQILVGELNNSVTGGDFLSRIIELLEKVNYKGDELSLLIDINKLLKKLDDPEAGNNIQTYQEIIKKIKKINIPFEEKYLFQVDMTQYTEQSVLGEDIMIELSKAMEFLNKLTPATNNDTIIRFQGDFYARYEDREVPLVEVLDPEVGLGYPSKSNGGDISPLLNNFNFPSPSGQSSNTTSSLLMQKTIAGIAGKQKEILLTDDDVKGSNAHWEDLPPTIYTMCDILNADPENRLIQASFFGGTSGANLLARFSHIDPRIEKFVKEITEKDQELMPDVVLAEIVHLPEARVGNILSRPHLRDYELLYLSDSDLPGKQLLELSDLMLSVKKGKLVIRSKKLNKEIIPRLTTAHNFRTNPLPVYRFLCDIQHARGRSSLYFSWGGLENEFSYRPRVRYNNVILSPASWTVKIEDIKQLFDIKEDKELIAKATKWRKTINLPEKVLMPDVDNELYVDWKNALTIRSLFSIIKKRHSIKLNEFLYDPEKALVSGSNGNYLNECIVAFYKNK